MSVVIRQAIRTKLQTHREFYPVYGEILGRLRQGYYNQKWIDILGQQHSRFDKTDIEEAFAFGQIWVQLLTGQIATRRIRVRSGPFPDKDIELNQHVLDKLCSPFQAHFAPEKGAGAHSDGWLSWGRSITMQTCIADLESGLMTTVSPDKAPLEVGTTNFSTTLMHLAADGCVARWPYYDEAITLLVKIGSKAVTDIPEDATPLNEEAFLVLGQEVMDWRE